MEPQELKRAFERGENITALLKKAGGLEQNTEEIIELAYDLQSGSYVKGLENPARMRQLLAYTKALVNVFREFGEPTTVMEAGVGEATTLSHVLDELGSPAIRGFGFDLVWSRAKCARRWLDSRGYQNAEVVTASLLHLPYADNSFDIVYTSHSIEPNHGREAPILAGLFRVTSRYLVLLEPAYELASPEARARMDAHGYCRNLVGHAKDQGMKVIRHELFVDSGNPLNPTALTVIEKNASAASAAPQYVCPSYRTPLQAFPDCYFSEKSSRAYPVIGGIACLRRESAIIASKYLEYCGEA